MVSQATIPGAPFNETHFSDPHYTALYKQAIATVDTAKRTALAHEMQQIDYQQGGYIIPYFPPTIVGYSKKVNGVVGGRTGLPFNTYDLKHLWFT